MNKHQKGTTAVEFAIVVALFLTVLLGILDFGRILFTWNAVGEATRWGARQAVVCGAVVRHIRRRERRKNGLHLAQHRCRPLPANHRQQEQTEHERSGIFEALVAIVVCLIRPFLAMVASK